MGGLGIVSICFIGMSESIYKFVHPAQILDICFSLSFLLLHTLAVIQRIAKTCMCCHLHMTTCQLALSTSVVDVQMLCHLTTGNVVVFVRVKASLHLRVFPSPCN